MSPKQTLKFKELQDKWYKKLKDSGFVDIEHREEDYFENSNNPYTPNLSGSPLSRKKSLIVYRQSVAEYYRLAGFFLHDYNFRNNLNKFVWEHHSNGVSIRDITKLLREKNIDVKKDTVWKIVKKLKEKMMKFYRSKSDE